jgi:hypothetical protein
VIIRPLQPSSPSFLSFCSSHAIFSLPAIKIMSGFLCVTPCPTDLPLQQKPATPKPFTQMSWKPPVGDSFLGAFQETYSTSKSPETVSPEHMASFPQVM